MFIIRPRNGVAQGAYRLEPRPADAGHGHLVLVFDGADRLHSPLTIFAREAARRLSANSVKVYLYALLRFFAFQDGRGKVGDHELWTGDCHEVRHAVGEYLEEQLGRVIRRHRLGFELVSVSGRTPTNVSTCLAALKLFYVAMR
jgi:hypothetical protein